MNIGVTSPTQQLWIAGTGSPKAPPPSAAHHPPAANRPAKRGGGWLMEWKQQAYALIISSIFNIHNALLISDALQQYWGFFPYVQELNQPGEVKPWILLVSTSCHVSRAVKMATWIHRCDSLQCCSLQPTWQPVTPPRASFPLRFFGWPDSETDGSDRAPLFPPRSQLNLPNPPQSFSPLNCCSWTADSLIRSHCVLPPDG